MPHGEHMGADAKTCLSLVIIRYSAPDGKNPWHTPVSIIFPIFSWIFYKGIFVWAKPSFLSVLLKLISLSETNVPQLTTDIYDSTILTIDLKGMELN